MQHHENWPCWCPGEEPRQTELYIEAKRRRLHGPQKPQLSSKSGRQLFSSKPSQQKHMQMAGNSEQGPLIASQPGGMQDAKSSSSSRKRPGKQGGGPFSAASAKAREAAQHTCKGLGDDAEHAAMLQSEE